MNSEQSKLRQHEQAEQESVTSQFHDQQQDQAQAQGREFVTVDDLLRYDSERNPVPTEVSEKLGKSLEAEKPPQPWYKKVFR